MAKKPKAPNRDSREWELTVWVAKFCSAVYSRRLRPSRAVYEEICSATLDHGYTRDEIRLAYWASKCIPGEWLGARLESGDVAADIVVRHRGGHNTQTGKPAKRWLDDLVSRAEEMNPVTVGYVLKKLVPEDMREAEKDLLDSEGIRYEWN